MTRIADTRMEKTDLVARIRQTAEAAFSVLGIAALIVSLVGLFVPQSSVAALAGLGWVLCGGAAAALLAYMATILLGEVAG